MTRKSGISHTDKHTFLSLSRLISF